MGSVLGRGKKKVVVVEKKASPVDPQSAAVHRRSVNYEQFSQLFCCARQKKSNQHQTKGAQKKQQKSRVAVSSFPSLAPRTARFSFQWLVSLCGSHISSNALAN